MDAWQVDIRCSGFPDREFAEQFADALVSRLKHKMPAGQTVTFTVQRSTEHN